MKARMYKAGVAATAVAVGAGIFGFAANASAASATVPVVSRLSFVKGSTAGGGILTVTGKNFAAGATVTFGTGSAIASGPSVVANTVFVSPTQLLVTVPAGTGAGLAAGVGGKVDVKVTTSDPSITTGKADDFTYLAPLNAAVASGTLLNPSGKSIIDVTTAGAGASAAAFKTNKVTATVNGKAAPVAYVSDTALKVTAPAGTPGGTAAVVLSHDGVAGASSTAANATFASVITKMSQNSGPVAGLNTVKITGKGFTGSGANWTFGGVAATCTVATDTSASCTVPASTLTGDKAGPVAVKFTGGTGTFGTTAAATYTYTNLG